MVMSKKFATFFVQDNTKNFDFDGTFSCCVGQMNRRTLAYVSRPAGNGLLQRPVAVIRSALRRQFLPSLPQPVSVRQSSTTHVVKAKSFKFTTNRSQRRNSDFKPPRPEDAGVHSPGRPLVRPSDTRIYAPRSGAEAKEGAHWSAGHPKTSQGTGCSCIITASKLYFLHSPSNLDNADFSVELPAGQPIVRPEEQERTAIKYGFFIPRTKSNQLPVYHVVKGGGNRLLTQIQHLQGDPRVPHLHLGGLTQELLMELQHNLQLPIDRITFNPLTKKVVIKGVRVKEKITALLVKLGF
jgi:Mitochondrial large subunit ribosomal protein (Img2)